MKRSLFVFIYIFPLFLLAQSALNEPVDFVIQNESITDALFSLSEEANINITFSPTFFEGTSRISVNAYGKPLKVVLRKCLDGTEVGFKTENGGIILYKKIVPFFTINGYLTDAKTGERLIGANILELTNARGSASNSYGFYSQNFRRGKIKLQVSYLGYQTKIIELDLDKGQQLDIALEPSLTLEEIVIVSNKKPNVLISPSGTETTLPLKWLARLPSAAGEADLIRYIQLLPGVQNGADGFGGLHVRGGNSDQNLILMDDVPIYNPSHTFGLFSIFNTDLAKSVRLYKSGFPAKYSGSISSVLDVRTREGNTQSFTAEASVSTMASRGLVEIPFAKNKGSLLIAGRTTHINTWLNPLSERKKIAEGNEGQMDYQFGDLNIKAHYSLGKKDKIYASFYYGKDAFQDDTHTIEEGGIPSDNTPTGDDDDNENNILDSLSVPSISFINSNVYQLKWGNKIGSLRWNHLYSDNLFSNTTLTYSTFAYSSESQYSSVASFLNTPLLALYGSTAYNSTIEDYSIRSDFDYFINNENYLKFGGGLIYKAFIPGLAFYESIANTIDNIEGFEEKLTTGGQRINAREANLYVEDEARFGPWTINAGLHLALFNTKNNFIFSPQPRISAVYKYSEKLQSTASITRTTQFLHLLTNTDSGLPSDLWVPSTQSISPQQAWQFTAGTQGKLTDFLHWNVETYYKKMENILRFNSAAFINNKVEINATNWENAVEAGSGDSYGLELLVEKNKGKITGWLGYTLAQSNRYYSGKKMADRFDSRHGITAATTLQLTTWMAFSANWVFNSGLPLYPSDSRSQEIPFASILQITTLPPDATRLPDYHRLDASLHFHFQTNKLQHKLNLGVYNLYNHQNTFFAYQETVLGNTKISSVGSLPVLPSVGYSVLFR